MEVSKPSVETAALIAFQISTEKFKKEMMKPPEEKEKAPENYEVSLLINDLPMRVKLIMLKPSKLNEVSTFSGASVCVKGRYIPSEENSETSKDQSLHLHIKGPNKQSMLLALQMIEHLVKDSAGPHENMPLVQVEKVLVGFEIAPGEFNLRDRVSGTEGSNLHYISSETEAEVSLRGRGSGYQEPDIGKESSEPLHIRIQHQRPEVVQAGRILALHLLETVRQEFAEYCSQQAQLIVTPEPVPFPMQKSPPSSESEKSWSPSSHNQYMQDDREEKEIWDSWKQDDPEPSSPKRLKYENQKRTGAKGNEVEKTKNNVHGLVETRKTHKYMPRTRGRRGGRKRTKFHKIKMYSDTLVKLQDKSLRPRERKELVDLIKSLKPHLSEWYYVKMYGDKDFHTQFQKICVERPIHKSYLKAEEGVYTEFPSEEQDSKGACFNSQVNPHGNIHRLKSSVLPLATPLQYMTPSPTIRPPHTKGKPFFPPGQTNSTHHTQDWAQNQLRNNQALNRTQWSPTQPSPSHQEETLRMNQRPPSIQYNKFNAPPTISTERVVHPSCQNWSPIRPPPQRNSWGMDRTPPIRDPPVSQFSQGSNPYVANTFGQQNGRQLRITEPSNRWSTPQGILRPQTPELRQNLRSVQNQNYQKNPWGPRH